MSDTESRQKIAQLQSQVTSLEQLLEVHERTAVEQSERLEQAMAELGQAKLQSEFQVAALEQLLEVHERTTIEQAEQLEQTMAALQIAKLQSEERLHTVITNVPVVIFALDRHGIFTLSEGKGLAALGLQPGQVVGQSAFDVYQDEPPLISEVKRALAGEAFSSTVEMGTLALETWYTPLRDQYGEPAGTIGVSMNITERKRLEDQIRESLVRRGAQVQTSTQVAQEIAAAPELEELFRRVVTLIKERFDYYHAQIFRYDPAQDAVVLVTGYGEAGRKMLAAGHKLAMGRGVVGTAAATGKSILATNVAQDPDWRPNPNLPDTKGELAVPNKLRNEVLGILDVQSDRAGALTAEDQLLLEGLCGQIAIASESRRVEDALHEREEDLGAMLEYSPEAIGLLNTQTGLFENVNRASELLYGLNREELTKVGPAQMSPEFQPDGRPSLDAAMEQIGAALRGETPVFEWVHRNAAGQPVQCEVRLSGLTGARKHLVRFSVTDITQRKQAEAKMQETLQELERLNRAATREGWRAFLQTGQLAPAYRYDRTAVQPAQELQMPQIEQAIQQNTLVPPSEENSAAVAPLSVRGAVIGALGVYDDPQHPLSPDELELLREIIEQGALALENARLYQDAQRRAAREQMINTVTAQVRSAATVNAILQHTVEELGRSFGVARATIELNVSGDDGNLR